MFRSVKRRVKTLEQAAILGGLLKTLAERAVS